MTFLSRRGIWPYNSSSCGRSCWQRALSVPGSTQVTNHCPTEEYGKHRGEYVWMMPLVVGCWGFEIRKVTKILLFFLSLLFIYCYFYCYLFIGLNQTGVLNIEIDFTLCNFDWLTEGVYLTQLKSFERNTMRLTTNNLYTMTFQWLGAKLW